LFGWATGTRVLRQAGCGAILELCVRLRRIQCRLIRQLADAPRFATAPSAKTLVRILKDDITLTDRHENHKAFFLTVLDGHPTAYNFVLTFPIVIQNRTTNFNKKNNLSSKK